MSIAHLIRAGRLANSMTEQGFADAIGVTRSAVQQWERGSTAPARKHQANVAALIGVSLGELMTGKAAKYPATEHHTDRRSPPPTGTRENPALSDKAASELFSRLAPKHKQEVINFMRFLSSQGDDASQLHRPSGEGDPVSPQDKAA